MLLTSPLDAVIKKIDQNSQSSQFSTSSTQKVVIIDAYGRTLSRRPLWGGSFCLFLVSTRNEVEFSIPDFNNIDDFSGRRSVPVSVECRVSCPVGNEDKVASSLAESSTPALAFENKVTSWLKQERAKFSFDSFVNDPNKYFIQIKQSVEDKISREIGLNAELRLSISNKILNQLSPVKVKASDFLVLVFDYESQLYLKFEARLLVNQSKLINTILSINNLNELESAFKEEIRSYFRRNISLYDYCYNFVEVRSKLIKNLNIFLSHYGREIEYLILEIDRAILMPELPPFKHDVICDIQEYPEPIIIKNTLEVEPCLTEVASYHKSKVTNIQDWFRYRLEEITKKLLFDARYINLLLNFEPIARSIKENLDIQARSIGYSIRLITTIPDLAPLKFKDEGFTFVINDTFSTKYYNVKVKLKIIVTGKIIDLNSIRNLLNSRTDIEGLIRKKVYDSASQLLHTTEPEHFYFHFEYYQEGKSVKTELIEKITNILREEFYASDITVIAQMLDTELTERFHKLQNQLSSFEIVIDSLQDLKESVIYIGSFRVERVAQDKWHIFQAREHSIDEIKHYLERFLISRLKTLTSDDLKYKDPHKLRKAEETISALVQEEIAEQFGIELKISALDRLRTDKDNNWNAVWKAATQDEFTEILEEIRTNLDLRAIDKQLLADNLASKRVELQNLQTELQGALTLEGNEDEIENIQNKIKNTQQEVSEIFQNYKERSKNYRQQFQDSVLLSNQNGFDALNTLSKVRTNNKLKPFTNINQQLHNGRDEIFDSQTQNSDLELFENYKTIKISEPRFPVLLLLDTSDSICEGDISEFTEGFSLFQQKVSQDETSRHRIEVAFVTLGNTAQMIQNFASVAALSLSPLKSNGLNATGEGIELALNLLEERLKIYRRDGIRHYPAWLFLITASIPNDSWNNAARLLKFHDGKGDLSFFTIALPGTNLGTLCEISPPRIPPVLLKQSKMLQLFSWIAEATTRVANNNLGSKVNLPDISGWAQL